MTFVIRRLSSADILRTCNSFQPFKEPSLFCASLLLLVSEKSNIYYQKTRLKVISNTAKISCMLHVDCNLLPKGVFLPIGIVLYISPRSNAKIQSITEVHKYQLLSI